MIEFFYPINTIYYTTCIKYLLGISYKEKLFMIATMELEIERMNRLSI
ncbi:hypothetical protein HUW76_08310 [Fusobacterium animalis]|nr:hypothetical protein [Fusobacterium animalis]